MKSAIRPTLAFLAAASLAACASSERPRVTPETTPPAAAPTFSMQPVRFADVPGWGSADLAPALAAFRRQCTSWRARGADAQVGANARYGGRVADWLPACSAADSAAPGQERAFFEANFTPNMVVSQNGQARLTAYYEPSIQVSRTPAPGMTEALRPRPNDMITVDVAAFAQAYDSETLRGAPRTLTGRLEGDRVRPYPSRAEITQNAGPAIAYANPVDVYNLQVQGSGRIVFADGAQRRAAFSAQNGYRWRSAIGAARESGQLPEGAGTWRGFRSWMDGLPADRQRAVLNADQSYVFFEDQAIADPSIGPRGAANVHLTPQGSMAVDPAFHPYGALIFVDATYEGGAFRRLMVAQDTGGAIRRGPLRGDVFWGSGPEAGQAAERMNADAPRFWTLVPRNANTPVAALDTDARTAR
ncbi:MAG: murein transglycosylase A [Hyphomonadaceae bacterium]